MSTTATPTFIPLYSQLRNEIFTLRLNGTSYPLPGQECYRDAGLAATASCLSRDCSRYVLGFRDGLSTSRGAIEQLQTFYEAGTSEWQCLRRAIGYLEYLIEERPTEIVKSGNY